MSVQLVRVRRSVISDSCSRRCGLWGLQWDVSSRQDYIRSGVWPNGMGVQVVGDHVMYEISVSSIRELTAIRDMQSIVLIM